MTTSIAGVIILLDCLIAWMLSGSPLPLGVSIIVGLVLAAAKTYRLRIGFLYSLFIAVSFGCIQWYLFTTEQAFVVLSDLPGVFHVGMICHWLFWLCEGDRKTDRSSGDSVFWISAAGSALIFLSASSIEFLEYPLWLIRFVAILPMVLIVGAEFLHRRRIGWITLMSVGLVSITLSQASVYSELGVTRLTALLDQDGNDESLADYDRDRSLETRRGNGGTDSRELATRADISFTHKIRFYAQTDDSPTFIKWTRKPVYVRTSTLAVFQSDSKIGPLRKGEWHYDSDDGTVDASTRISAGDDGYTFLYSMLIHRSDLTQLPVISGTRKINVDSVYEFAAGWYQLSAEDEIEWLRFEAEAVSEYSVFPEENSSWITSSIFPAPPESPYLALPKTALGERVRGQTELLLKELPPEKHPHAIAAFLKENCQYSLRYLNPKNLPPVENFLFNERRGHCELFAAATVLMLRSAGIPSRIAYGYTGGQADNKSNVIAFRDSDFHSWAEILLADGHTWAVFDTTPVNPDSARRAPVSGSLGKVDLSRYRDIGKAEYVPLSEGIFTASFLDDVLEWMSVHFLTLIIGLPAFAFLFHWFRNLRRQKPGDSLFDPANGITTLPQSILIDFTFVDAILELGKSYGFKKESGQTLVEFIHQLRSNGVGSPDLFEAVDYAYGVRYAGKNRDSRAEKIFLRSIRKLISTAS